MHGIVPQGVRKQVKEMIDGVYDAQASKTERRTASELKDVESMSESQLGREIKRLERQMIELAKNLEFEKAARVREQLGSLRERAFIGESAGLRRVMAGNIAERAL